MIVPRINEFLAPGKNKTWVHDSFFQKVWFRLMVVGILPGAGSAMMNFHDQDRHCGVILSPSLRSRINSAKDLMRWAQRSFASLRMTCLVVPPDPLADLVS